MRVVNVVVEGWEVLRRLFAQLCYILRFTKAVTKNLTRILFKIPTKIKFCDFFFFVAKTSVLTYCLTEHAHNVDFVPVLTSCCLLK